MPLFLPIIAIIILGVAEISMNTTPTPTPQEALGEKIEEEKKKPTPTHTEKVVETESSVKIVITSTPTKMPTEKPSASNYIYPRATVSSQSGNETHLETVDSPQTVTDWYKNYIQGNGMNTTSFVTTNTNNNVLNRLVGAGGSQKIDVEIKRNENESMTEIKILL